MALRARSFVEAVTGLKATDARAAMPAQVVKALSEYHDPGVTHVRDRGFDPLEDARQAGGVTLPSITEEAS